METPEAAKARKAPAVRREVVRVVTPATVTEDSLLEGARPSWLLALAPRAGAGRRRLAGRLAPGRSARKASPRPSSAPLLARLEPAEVLAPRGAGRRRALTPLGGTVREVAPPRDGGARAAEAWGVASLAAFGAFTRREAAALAMALDYVRATGGGTLPRLAPPEAGGGSARPAHGCRHATSAGDFAFERGSTATVCSARWTAR